MNAGTNSRALSALTMALLIGATAGARAGTAADTAPRDADGSSASPVSATGLLPIFGVAVDFDALPRDAKPDEAVARVQKLWDGYLKGAGFNVLQFPVDVRELGDRGAARLAKLCIWAKANDVRLAPTLVGSDAGEPAAPDLADRVGAFAAKTIELVGRDGDPQAYSQIMFCQIERPLNHPASHGPMEPAQAAELLRQSIEKLHAAEQAALAGTPLQATPVLARASFDYELIRFGAIANVPLTDAGYQQAYESFRDYLAALLSAAPVDVIGIEWYPGSLSSDAVDRFPDLVTRLQADFPGKLLLVHTGYSTAAGGEEAQSRYYTQTFNNLSDLRANQGVESSFAGILWRTAMDRSGSEPSPPSSKTMQEMAGWNWPERAAEVTRMWNEPGTGSKEMRWWLGRVESRFGLLGPGKDISKPGEPKLSYQLLSKLKTSLAAAAEATGAGEIAKELSSAGGARGALGVVKEKLQSALFGMLDAWIARTAENLVGGGVSSGGGGAEDHDGGGGGGGSGASAPPPPSNLADLQIAGVGAVEEIKAQTATPLAFTVVNSGTAAASNVVLYLRENSTTDLANSTPSTLAAGATSTITLTWTPSRPGNHKVTLDAYCDNEGDVSSNHVDFGDVLVSPASAGGGGGGSGGAGGGAVGGIKGGFGKLGTVQGVLQTSTDPGFIRIEQVRSVQPVVLMTASGGGSGVQVMGSSAQSSAPAPGGGAQGGTASVSYSMTGTPSGPQPISLAFTVTNPFDHNFTGVRGTLKIEGKVVATKDLGILFPRQRRTVTFAQWTPTKAGTFPVRIELAGMGPGRRALTATATDRITVSAAALRGGSGAVGGPMAGAAGADPSHGSKPTRSVIGGKSAAGREASPSRGGAGAGMTLTQTRLMTPLILAPAPSSTAPPKTRALVSRIQKASLGMVTLLGVDANAISLTPFPAQAGNDVDVAVRLLNSDRQPAEKVKVEAFIGSDKLGETTVDVPVARSVVARGFRSWSAKPGRHDVRVVVTWGARSGAAVKPIDIRPPHAVGKGGVALLVNRSTLGLALALPRLVIAPADVRLNPLVPAAGTPVEVSVRVQNAGNSEAKAVRVELFANGVRLGEALGDIAPGKDHLFSGFPRWTPAAGKHLLLCRATVAGQVTEATREINAAATATLVKPTLTTRTPVTLADPTITTGLTLRVLEAPDLQILPSDITFAPATPKAGEPLTITLLVRNIGTGAAEGGMVRALLQVDGSDAGSREFPVTIAAKGMTTLIWPVTTPSGKTLTAVGTAKVSGDTRADNNEGRASTSIAVTLVKPQLLILPEGGIR